MISLETFKEKLMATAKKVAKKTVVSSPEVKLTVSDACSNCGNNGRTCNTCGHQKS